jgi:molybdopterin-guanine dinucleotide biosynthesis protein A
VSAIAACLADTCFAWNLIVACDMPGANREWLRFLLDSAAGDVLLPQSSDSRLHPLCAVWNRSAAERMADAVTRGVHAVKDAVRLLDYRTVPATDEERVANVNTPEEWARVQE